MKNKKIVITVIATLILGIVIGAVSPKIYNKVVQSSSLSSSSESEREKHYVDTFKEHIRTWEIAKDRFSNLLSDPQFDSNSWKKKLKVELLVMNGLINKSREMKPTRDLKEVHGHYMSAVDYYEILPREMMDSIENGDINTLERIYEGLVRGNMELNKAIIALNKIN